MSVDWEWLKALYFAYDAGTMGHGDYVRFSQGLEQAFPAILAQHEQDQRVIEAAKKLRVCISAWVESVPEYSMLAKNLEGALAEFDRVKP